MEDKIERDVQGYIGYVPKGDEVTRQLWTSRQYFNSFFFHFQEGQGRKTVWKIDNFRLVEVRDLSSFPMYKNKTLPSKGKKNGNGDRDRDKGGNAFMMMQEGIR